MYSSQPTNTVQQYVQQRLGVVSEFTGEAHGFMINFLCGTQGQKVVQHCPTGSK